MKTKQKTTNSEMQDELEKFTAIDILSESDGGKVLIESLTKDVVACIETICSSFQTSSHIELVATSAKLKERINLLQVLKRAKKNKEFISDEIKNLIIEEITQ